MEQQIKAAVSEICALLLINSTCAVFCCLPCRFQTWSDEKEITNHHHINPWRIANDSPMQTSREAYQKRWCDTSFAFPIIDKRPTIRVDKSKSNQRKVSWLIILQGDKECCVPQKVTSNKLCPPLPPPLVGQIFCLFRWVFMLLTLLTWKYSC